MILCIEIGNTCIKIGVFNDTDVKPVEALRINTERTRSAIDYSLKLKSIFGNRYNFDDAIISSVVPSLKEKMKLAIILAFNIDAKILDNSYDFGMGLDIDNTKEIGLDFLCTAAGVKALGVNVPFAIADFGTCTKISVVDTNGNFIGRFITTGLNSDLKGLINGADQLYEVELDFPSRIIGKSTKESIQSGICYGQAFMIEETIRRMEQELGYRLNRFICGGYGRLIQKYTNGFRFEIATSLIGLNQIYKLNKSKSY